MWFRSHFCGCHRLSPRARVEGLEVSRVARDPGLAVSSAAGLAEQQQWYPCHFLPSYHREVNSRAEDQTPVKRPKTNMAESDGDAVHGTGSDDENAPPKDADAELEAAIAAIRGNRDLPRPPYPTLPNMNAPAPMSAKVAAVQAYIEKLSYNFTGVNYFDVRKHRPMGRILETGREITRQALPIKCVEAVFVGAYLTQGLKELERVPFSFRSQIDGVTYKHIVLALKHNSKWGSIGLSRRRELYYKDLVYDSFAELFLEYKRSYERVFHTLRRVKVGLPLPHEVHAGEVICWSYISVKCLDVPAASQLLADHGRSEDRAPYFSYFQLPHPSFQPSRAQQPQRTLRACVARSPLAPTLAAPH